MRDVAGADVPLHSLFGVCVYSIPKNRSQYEISVFGAVGIYFFHLSSVKSILFLIGKRAFEIEIRVELGFSE